MNLNDDDDNDDGDRWLRQFEDGQRRKEERANSTGWGCAIAVGMFVLMIILLASGSGHHG